MTEIVLAYSSIDKARAEAVAKVLAALGYSVAPQPPTAAQVEACKALVAFWSSGSVNSIPINQLAQQASLKRRLVSVRAAHADPPAAFALVALHDLSRWTGSLESPELRTFLQHLLRMAPPATAPQQTISGAAMAPPPSTPFNFAGPQGAFVRPNEAPARPVPAPTFAPPPQLPTQLEPDFAPDPPPRPVPAPPPRPSMRAAGDDKSRPSVLRAAERRRAAGGGAARVAFGAIAVSVIAGAAVAAFNYESGQPRTASAPLPAGPRVAVAVAPNTLSPPTATDAAPIGDGAGVQLAAAAAPPPVATPSEAATVQSTRGWTATLPTLPTARAIPVSGGTGGPAVRQVALRSAVASGALTPIDGPRARPAPTDLVAVDHANLGAAEAPNTLDPRPRTPEEERAWIRRNTEYGPAQ